MPSDENSVFIVSGIHKDPSGGEDLRLGLLHHKAVVEIGRVKPTAVSRDDDFDDVHGWSFETGHENSALLEISHQRADLKVTGKVSGVGVFGKGGLLGGHRYKCLSQGRRGVPNKKRGMNS